MQSKALYKTYYDQSQLINDQLKQIQQITKSKILNCTMTVQSDFANRGNNNVMN